MKAERTVIGTRRSSCVASLNVVLVVDREAVWRARDKERKEKRKNQQDHVRTGAPTRKSDLFRAWLQRDSYDRPACERFKI